MQRASVRFDNKVPTPTPTRLFSFMNPLAVEIWIFLLLAYVLVSRAIAHVPALEASLLLLVEPLEVVVPVVPVVEVVVVPVDPVLPVELELDELDDEDGDDATRRETSFPY